ncbi:MAG: UDP-N-acetylmuramate dehydrogenase [Verrucomicrobia bacterium]|nr:UDP-N-acetylmuramate dehydrogenase [Verrucomicrobiota bacterium]
MVLEGKSFCFAGVGGMGMAPLAAYLAAAGHTVAGQDDYLQTEVRDTLESAGVDVRDFLFSEELNAFDVLVYSSALRPDHPLLQGARAVGLKVMRRGELLAEVAAGRRLLAVVGSHGKTTTAGLIAHGLVKNGLNADFILGGFFAHQAHAPYRFSGSDWLVAEVDESDGTIGAFNPEATLVLNLDWDHADHYPDAAALKSAFKDLLERTTATVLAPEDLREHLTVPEALSFKSWPPAGKGMNAANAIAARTALELIGGQELEQSCLDDFPGMARRQTCLHRDVLLAVYEDYAHHPTEIEALIEHLRTTEPERRLAVVFQAHRYSRTRQFKDELARALGGADQVFLLPIYGAHEAERAGGEMINFTMAFGASPPTVLPMTGLGMEKLAMGLGDEPLTLAFVGAGDIHHFAAAFVSQVRSGFERANAWLDYMTPRVSKTCTMKTDEPLANKTTMRVGGAATFYAEPENMSDLLTLLRGAALFQLPVFSLGRGSNIVVPDEGFAGLVLRFNSGLWRESRRLADGRLWVGAGVRLKEVCGQAAKAGLAGFEFLEGIPGSVGGSLRMNAGAMGSWIFDVVERVQLLESGGAVQDLPKAAFHFGYRKVEEISQGIALGAILRSPEAETGAAIRERMDSYASVRKASQPREPSAGCICKNPEGDFAGKLIDTHGLKGLRVGDAEVSDVHGNFIINKGAATAADIIELVRQVRAKVYHASGQVLEPEVLLLGQDWDVVLGDLKEVGEGDNG